MFRKLGTFLGALGVSITVGLALIMWADFISQISYIEGIPSLINEMFLIGYSLGTFLALTILVIPIDFYFIVWGSSLTLDTPIIVVLELFIFFGIIGLVIGLRTSKDDESARGNIWDAVLTSYIFIIIVNIIIIIIIWILTPFILGTILSAIIQGITGKDLLTFFITSVVENGTMLAVFSAFVSSILSDSTNESSINCNSKGICKL